MTLSTLTSPLTLTLFSLLFLATAITAQTPAFTYQGRLTDNSLPASGDHDMQFKLFDGGGNQVGNTITYTGVSVLNGVFTDRF